MDFYRKSPLDLLQKAFGLIQEKNFQPSIKEELLVFYRKGYLLYRRKLDGFSKERPAALLWKKKFQSSLEEDLLVSF